MLFHMNSVFFFAPGCFRGWPGNLNALALSGPEFPFDGTVKTFHPSRAVGLAEIVGVTKFGTHIEHQ